MSTYGQILTLVQAHYAGSEVLFRRTVLQIAARLKDEKRARELANSAAVKQMTMLPSEAHGMAWEMPRVSLDDLKLEPGVETQLRGVARELRHATGLAARGFEPRNRILLHGPPGCGKTSAASALAGLVGQTLYCCSLAAVVESYLGESTRRLDRLFSILRAGGALLLDEFDAIGGERGTDTNSARTEMNRTVNFLLTLMDKERSGLLICTTNRPDLLDPAIKRRFNETLFLAGPTEVELREFAQALGVKLGISFEGIPPCELGQNFDSATKRVLREARSIALEELERESAA